MSDPEELAARASGARDPDPDVGGASTGTAEDVDDVRDQDDDRDDAGDREVDLGAALMSTTPDLGLEDAPDALGLAGREFYIAGAKIWNHLSESSSIEELDGQPAIVNIGIGVGAMLGLIGPGGGADRADDQDGDRDQESSGGEHFEPGEQ